MIAVVIFSVQLGDSIAQSIPDKIAPRFSIVNNGYISKNYKLSGAHPATELTQRAQAVPRQRYQDMYYDENGGEILHIHYHYHDSNDKT